MGPSPNSAAMAIRLAGTESPLTKMPFRKVCELVEAATEMAPGAVDGLLTVANVGVC